MYSNMIKKNNFGRAVGFGCRWAKLNVLQKRLLMCRLAALLILRSFGNLSSDVSTNVDV
jgi:hypothetical protein